MIEINIFCLGLCGISESCILRLQCCQRSSLTNEYKLTVTINLQSLWRHAKTNTNMKTQRSKMIIFCTLIYNRKQHLKLDLNTIEYLQVVMKLVDDWPNWIEINVRCFDLSCISKSSLLWLPFQNWIQENRLLLTKFNFCATIILAKPK